MLSVVTWVIATVLTGSFGPMGTFSSMTIVPRLFYWGGIIGASIIVGFGIRFVMLRLVGRDGLRTDFYGGMVMAPVFGSAIYIYNTATNAWPAIDPVSWMQHVVLVFMVSLGVVVLRHYGRLMQTRAAEAEASRARAEANARATAPVVVAQRAPVVEEGTGPVLAEHRGSSVDLTPASDIAPGPEGAFLRRLDPALGQDLKSVSANDHYLEVITEAGTQRLLMRFRDALEELEPLPGLRIHRSHWVAKSAICGARRQGRRTFVELCNGQSYPVSAAYLPELRALGFSVSDEPNAKDGADAA